jgi:selenocysteine lyase/cysteine desulfurase
MNIEAIRELFPVVKKWIYFNHAISSPLNVRTLGAMNEAMEDMSVNGVVHYSTWVKIAEELRENCAVLLKTSRDNIAIIRNYMEGLSIVANGYNWKEGDNIILSDLEFEPLIYHWLGLASKGVEVKFVQSRDEMINIEDVIKGVDERTRMIILSQVQYLNGYRISLSELTQFCREKDILLVAEGSHSAGALDIDVNQEGIDVFIASGNKWLLGPEGSGILYLSHKAMEKLPSTTIGWRSADYGEDSTDYPIKFYESARKYEPSGLSMLSVYGFNASIKLLLEIGMPNIEKRILDLTAHLITKLKEKGYEIKSKLARERMSGVVGFHSKIISARDICANLLKNKVVVSEKRNLVRVSVHVYNTQEEINQFVSFLE